MPSTPHNTKSGKERRGSSEDNIAGQRRETRDPEKSNARDREGRKGGSNEKNL